MATLTGVMHMALGDHISGFLSTDETYQREALHAGDSTGDRSVIFRLLMNIGNVWTVRWPI